MSKLAADGHGLKGEFLPPVPLPLRMWASGELTRHDPFRIGDAVERVSRIAEVEVKTGRTGQLCFVTIENNFTTPRGLALHERQHIVYREAAQPGATPNASASASPKLPAQWQSKVEIDTVRLFRYSALTFNGHRIHFDRDYCRAEGYPGLIVHGPLQASFLAEFATSLRAGQTPRVFTYRALRPLFEVGVLTLNARESADGLDLWAEGYDGATTLKAHAQW
jgi:3-methylfumaryl-CoA hydratase